MPKDLLALRHTNATLHRVLPQFNTNRKTPEGTAPDEAVANDGPAQKMLRCLLAQLSPAANPGDADASARQLSMSQRQSSFKLEKKKSGVDVIDLDARANIAHVLEGVAEVCDPDQLSEAAPAASEKPANLKEEAVLGDYLLQKTIGEGCFSKVKMAIHFPTGHKVAIKCMDKKLMNIEIGTSERTLREILVLSHLYHPNITRLLEVVDTEEFIYLILEYEEGGELFDYIVAKSALPEAEARTKFRQILSAIQYCHINGIVHRDLKPENILSDKQGNMKLIDFGFSNVVREGNLMETFCGSPSYAAPEMIARRKYNGQDVDIWALGVILFVLLCGYHPFDHQHMGRMYSNILAARYKFPDEKIQISENAKDILTQILKVKPNERATLETLRTHPWTTDNGQLPPVEFYELPAESPVSGPSLDGTSTRGDPCHLKDVSIISELKRMGFSESEIEYAKKTGDPGPVMAAYHLLRAEKKRNAPPLSSPAPPLSSLAPSTNLNNSKSPTPTESNKETASMPPPALPTKPNLPAPLEIQTTILQNTVHPINEFIPRTPVSTTTTTNHHHHHRQLVISIDKGTPTTATSSSPLKATTATKSSATSPTAKIYILHQKQQHKGERNYSTTSRSITTTTATTATTPSLETAIASSPTSATTVAAGAATGGANSPTKRVSIGNPTSLLSKLRSPTGMTPTHVYFDNALLHESGGGGSSEAGARGGDELSFDCPGSGAKHGALVQSLESKFNESEIVWEKHGQGTDEVKYACHWKTPGLVGMDLEAMVEAVTRGIITDPSISCEADVGSNNGLEFIVQVSRESLIVESMKPKTEMCRFYVGQLIKAVLVNL